uniref:G-protein coupled receptors family 1 profile domain-containing protein n=1 Tax=Electrophorus electricus TaxID=8005 RepID=A0A4W4HM50_ELEEL
MAAWSNFTSALSPELVGLNGSHTHFWVLRNSSTSATQIPAPARMRDIALARAEIGVLSLVLALTALGNGFVLWVLLRRRKHNAPMHLFMVNLCVADLVVAFFQVLPQLVWDITETFQGPDALCRTVKYMQIVGMFASSYMIVAMTVDRHYAICCPLRAYKGGGSLMLEHTHHGGLGSVFIFSRSEVAPGVFECWGHFAEDWGLKAYVTWMTLAVFLLPAFIVTVCQVTDLSCIRCLSLVAPISNVSMSKTVRMTLVIVLVYITCWSPFFIVQLWAAWDPNPPSQGVAFTILMLLASLNSCTNPWIYTAFSSSVSRELLTLLHCPTRPSRRGSAHEDSSGIHTSTTTKDNPY